MNEVFDRFDPDQNLFDQLNGSCDYYNIDEFNSLIPSSDVKGHLLLNYNIRSFNANGDKFAGFLGSLKCNVDFLALTETWNTVDNIDLCKLETFRDYHTYRSSARSGGVSLFISERFNSDKVANFSVCDINIESCAVKVHTHTGYVLILALYRPHSGTVEQFSQALDGISNHEISQRSEVIVVCGDININTSSQTTRDVNDLLSSIMVKK